MAALELKTPDMVPVMPVVDTYHSPKLLGLKLSECYTNGEKMAEAQLAALHTYGYDGILISLGPGKDPTNFLGCKLRIPEDDVPIYIEPAIKVPADLDALPMPDPWGANQLKPIETIIDEVGNTHFVAGVVHAPYEYVTILRGFYQTLIDLKENAEFIRKILERAVNITQIIGTAQIEAGVHGMVVKDSVASPTVLSPKLYEEFAFAYETAVIKYFKKKGVQVILHICTDSSLILDKMANTGASALEIDHPVNLTWAKTLVGNRVCLKGNLDPVNVVYRGTPRNIMKKCRECIQDATQSGGFILSTGDSIPKDTPLENVKAIVQAARTYGKYPIF